MINMTPEELDLEELELQKQYEFMSYADESYDADAEYYGEQ